MLLLGHSMQQLCCLWLCVYLLMVGSLAAATPLFVELAVALLPAGVVVALGAGGRAGADVSATSYCD